MTDNEPRFVSVDELPDDPFAMPPPYWRSSGAVFHILKALEEISNQLSTLVSVNAQTSKKLRHYFAKYASNKKSGRKKEDKDNAVFSRICDELWSVEHDIKLECERAILMCAITAEDGLNTFCVYNLHRDLAETIEKLSSPEKLLVASGALGKHGVKTTDVYAGAKRLTGWRNAFAHGHCVDRPVKSLRHNHLIGPDEYPGVPNAIKDVIQQVGSYLAIEKYLRSISLNSYTSGNSYDDERIEKYLVEVRRYSFSGNEHTYSLRRVPARRRGR